MGSDTAYYYDVDKAQVRLQPADDVAVDLGAAARAGVSDDLMQRLERQSRELRGDVVLLHQEDLSETAEKTLETAGALQPVFRADDGTLVVVLPEVRIEAADEKQVREIHTCLRAAGVASEVVRDEGEQLVVRPRSARGADALELANRLTETVDPLLAQARFLRVVPRPGVRAPVKRQPVRRRS